jgi:lysyl-tRNA synthetase class 2
MSPCEVLALRASLFRKARLFFHEKGIMEVDVPALSPYASVDAHIDLIPASFNKTTPCTLFSSPEYGMKRLLAQGSGDIYQLAHVFRDGELGVRHHPEFMMAEWYRKEISFAAMIEETLDFIRLFLGPLPSKTKSYRDLFIEKTGINPLKTTPEALQKYCTDKQIPLYKGIEVEGLDGYLSVILSTFESEFGSDSLFVLSHYPASQAALARTLPDGTAERFEVYYKGVELANGYHELANALEQEKRLHEANEARLRMGKEPLPIDKPFLEALRKGLPACCGVAVGVDRLIMLASNSSTLRAILPDPQFS